jgi:hypothetical protein
MAVAKMDWDATTQVGQGKVDPSIAAIGGSKQREQRLVLVDGQQLTIAQRPAFGREIEADDLDLGQEGF